MLITVDQLESGKAHATKRESKYVLTTSVMDTFGSIRLNESYLQSDGDGHPIEVLSL